MTFLNSCFHVQDKQPEKLLADNEIRSILASDDLRTVLVALYEFRYSNQGESSIQALIETRSLRHEEVWQAINLLEEANWVKMWNIEGKYTVTGIGAVNLERISVAPQVISRRSQAARDWLINRLVNNYSHSHRENSIVRPNLYKTDELSSSDIDLAIADCCDLGQVTISSADIRLLPSGFRYYKERARWQEISELFGQLRLCSTPQKRGVEFQRLFSVLIEMNAWSVEESARSSNEEIDILVHREREDYLTECKWEQKPVEAAKIREFQGKLFNRSGVRGIFASMSGFSQGAVKQAEEQLLSRELLLFGPVDLGILFAEEQSFEGMLTEKHRVVVQRKRCIWK